ERAAGRPRRAARSTRRPTGTTRTLAYRPWSGRHVRDAPVGGIRPAGIGDQRRPARSQRILVVRIRPEPQERFVIAGHALAVEPHAQPRSRGDGDRAVAVLQFPALDAVVEQAAV